MCSFLLFLSGHSGYLGEVLFYTSNHNRYQKSRTPPLWRDPALGPSAAPRAHISLTNMLNPLHLNQRTKKEPLSGEVLIINALTYYICLTHLYLIWTEQWQVTTTIVYLSIDNAKTIEIKKPKFWHSIQISLNYVCKDFQFGTWLQNRLHRVSIFPLAGNPEISSTTLKTFCSQSIKCYSRSHWRQDNNYQLSAFHWTETYWCKNRSGSVLLMWLSLSHNTPLHQSYFQKLV